MKTVYKFPLMSAQRQPIVLTRGAEVLSAQMQRDVLCLWVLMDPDAVNVEREVTVAGTGHALTNDASKDIFVGTVQMEGGALVFHVFVSKENTA